MKLKVEKNEKLTISMHKIRINLSQLMKSIHVQIQDGLKNTLNTLHALTECKKKEIEIATNETKLSDNGKRQRRRMKKKKRKSKGRKEEKQKTDSQHIIEKKISNGNANKVNIIQYIGKEALKSKNKIISKLKSLINNTIKAKNGTSTQSKRIMNYPTNDELIKKKMEIIEIEVDEKLEEDGEELSRRLNEIIGKTKKIKTTNEKQNKKSEPIWINNAQQNKNNNSDKTITFTNQVQYDPQVYPTPNTTEQTNRDTSEIYNQESTMEPPYNSTMYENEDEEINEKINEVKSKYIATTTKNLISMSIKYMEIAELLMR